MTAVAQLSIARVTTGYTTTRVLDDVSLTLGAGEVVGVLGANGAGKSTLLRAVAGVIPIWSGHVSVDGADVTKRSMWARVRGGCAHVPEGRRLFPSLTVQQNLEVARRPGRDHGDLWESIDEIFPKLAERRKQVAGTLSGGEQQMVAIARALATNPRYLLIDEMSAGLAPIVVHILVESIQRIAARGVGVLVVEQSPDYVIDIVSRVVLLERGSVVDQGTLADVGGHERLVRMYLGAD